MTDELLDVWLMMPVLRIENLHKSFPMQRTFRALLRSPFRSQLKVALDDCSFCIARGEYIALIGPNGAGKTTLARIICGTTLRDSGKAFIDGLDVATLPAHARVALARPDDPALHPRLTAFEALHFNARLYGLDISLESALERPMEALDVGPLMHRRITTLSAGEKAKISLCKALMTQPSLLIMDELSRVLDPKAAERVRLHLDIRCQEGLAVLLITHALEEARRCHRVLAMAQGRILASGPWDEVRPVAHVLFDLKENDEDGTSQR